MSMFAAAWDRLSLVEALNCARSDVRTLRRQLADCEVDRDAAQRAHEVTKAQRDDAWRQLYEEPNPEAVKWHVSWRRLLDVKERVDVEADALAIWVRAHGGDPAEIVREALGRAEATS